MAKSALKEFTPPEWWEKFQTYQGMYVVSPDAQCYDYRVAWQLPADKYLGILEQALEKYAASEPQQISITADVSTKSTSPAPDASTTVLRVFSRIRPLPAGCDDGNRGIGRDHMWIFEDEVQELLMAARKAQGKPFAMPRRITGRLVRFQLLDTVRNVSPAFAESDVKHASFTLQSLAERRHELLVFRPVRERGTDRAEWSIVWHARLATGRVSRERSKPSNRSLARLRRGDRIGEKQRRRAGGRLPNRVCNR